MDWTDDHDIALMKEVRIENPFKTKKKTSARAQIWQKIADKLSGVKQPLFKENMSKRSIQDRYILVSDKYKQRMRREAAASGISPSYSELDQLIEECIGLEKLEDDLRQKDSELSLSKEEKDRESALEIRRVAMENLSQSKKRKEATCEDEVKKKKLRKTGNDTMEYLKEKNLQEAAIREQELKIREQELKLKEDIEKQRIEYMMAMMHQQQELQQQQHQQFQAVMTQQNELMKALILKSNVNKNSF